MRKRELIALVRKNFGEPVDSVLDACEVIYANGCSDECAGDMAYGIGHVYRVSRWLVFTDSQGFRTLEEYRSERAAKRAFAEAEKQTAYDEDDAAYDDES
jgi:hypothetical protein